MPEARGNSIGGDDWMTDYFLDPTAINREIGFAWTAVVPAQFGLGDTSDEPACSSLVVFEDDTPLGPAHASHAHIRELGKGSYSHWHNALYFSTPDGSDPRENGRLYRLFPNITAANAALGWQVRPPLEQVERRFHQEISSCEKPHVMPFNQDATAFGDPVAAAEYDKQIFDAWINQLNRWAGRSSGLNILELGPGILLGTQILLSECGNRVSVADAFPPPWRDDFHPPAYRHLARLIGGSSALEHAARGDSFANTGIKRVPQPAEALSALGDAEFDAILSNAVLEHIANLDQVCAELARVTKPGGINIHQIDLAYHKNRARPLDHLLLGDEEFFAEARAVYFEYGNRWRKSEFVARFDSVGFEVISASTNLHAEDEYRAEIARTIKYTESPYRDWPVEELTALSVLLVARRRP